MDQIETIVSKFSDLFAKTLQKEERLEDLRQEILSQNKTIRGENLHSNKNFSANKKFTKEMNEETRSQVSFKISGGNRLHTIFDDSKSLRMDTFYEGETRFKKKDLENLSPKSIKSHMSGPFNFQNTMDDNISHFTYGVIQEETDVYNSSSDEHENVEREESVRAQKDFGLLNKKTEIKYLESAEANRISRRQLGVLCDRLGRLLVDLAPHFMLDPSENNSRNIIFGLYI